MRRHPRNRDDLLAVRRTEHVARGAGGFNNVRAGHDQHQNTQQDTKRPGIVAETTAVEIATGAAQRCYGGAADTCQAHTRHTSQHTCRSVAGDTPL